jgi:eukaryotic-like serine/threonine-protein kinase
VYRARDTRLDRTVALKILAGTISTIDDRITLEREGRAVAALNHPHICALHDISRERETPFLVMEYVQGETLAARVARGPLPPRDTIRYAIQIGEALDHAHRQGIVHRDLKPANIMLTRTGAARQSSPHAKLLDVGLAKLRPAAAISMSGATRLATATPNTSQGTILGTVQYMSPEQLEGREADARSGIWRSVRCSTRWPQEAARSRATRRRA